MFTLRTGGESFVTAHIGDEDIGKGLVDDGLLMVDKKGGRKLAKLVKEYEDAMARAKKNHLNIWQYGDITQDDAREFGSLVGGGVGQPNITAKLATLVKHIS